MEDKTSIITGLDAAQGMCAELQSECQIIILTDADHPLPISLYRLADHLRLHIIVVSGEDEKSYMDLEDDLDIESAYQTVSVAGGGNQTLKSLTVHNHGTYHRIQTDQGQYVTKLKSTFDDIIDQYCK